MAVTAFQACLCVPVKPKIFVQQRVIHATIGQKITLECLTESFPNSGEFLIPLPCSIYSYFHVSVNYWMRGHSDYTNKDYVLGGHYETIIDGEGGIYKVVMKLVVKLQKPSDFGIFKCVAKNALGSSEEIIKVLRKFSIFSSIFLYFRLAENQTLLDIIRKFSKHDDYHVTLGRITASKVSRVNQLVSVRARF